MQFAFDFPLQPGFSKKLFFLTDGGVGNHKAVVDLVIKNQRKMQLHTLGIQCEGEDEELVLDCAKYGGGTASVVEDT